MAEENSNQNEPTTNAGEGGTEPQGNGAAETTDWKAEARKWEKRAKASEKQLESTRGEQRAQAEASKTAEEQLASLREELDSMKAERDQEKWLSEVAAETGVDASLIRGTTKEEMKSHAEAIAKVYKKPAAPGGQNDTGNGKNGPKMTKQEIMAIKSSKERKAAIAANLDLFE